MERNNFLSWMPFFAGLILSGLLGNLAYHLALNYRIVDFPGGRKIHKGIIPRGGGLALYLAMIVGLLYDKGMIDAAYLASGASVVFFSGFIDDIVTLTPISRLISHFIAWGIVFYPYLLTSQLDNFSLFILFFWGVGMINAYNLVDGLDGLASTCGCVSLVVAARLHGWGYFETYMTGVVMAFLIFNIHPARMFLGDGGSTLLGLTCAFFLMKSAPIANSNHITLIPFMVLLGGFLSLILYGPS